MTQMVLYKLAEQAKEIKSLRHQLEHKKKQLSKAKDALKFIATLYNKNNQEELNKLLAIIADEYKN